ncbi:LysR family transcriptional regulator [Butyrivibrio sp. MC2013]|uniref:LysR family transcriptional regulator n=1 Tax=Butyrivibrio sp. MC2013 TaxID=1280686 RepID=UPI00041DABE4|nr:LysR family transcriptional regulator [Butyrivibrio sp. MC2013]
MELLQLRYFCEIARQENISKAGEVLHVSQPSLSRTLSTLEAELGTRLFDREGRNIRLNHNGEIYYRNISKALNMIDNAKNELLDFGSNPFGHLTLIILAGSNIAPDMLINFHKLYPNISLNLKQQATHNLQQAGDFDFVISATPGNYRGLVNIKLLEEDIVIAAHKDHPLAQKSSINLAEAAPYQFVTYSIGPSIRQLTDQLCLQAGFAPNIILESDSPGTFKSFVQSQMGIALLPYQTQKSFFNSLITPVRITSPECKRTIFLSYQEGHYLGDAARIFMDFCTDFFSKIG